MKTYRELIKQAAEIRMVQKENAKLFDYTSRDKAEDAMFLQGYLNAIVDMYDEWLENGIETVREDVKMEAKRIKRGGALHTKDV